jgi:hypothetical protein
MRRLSASGAAVQQAKHGCGAGAMANRESGDTANCSVVATGSNAGGDGRDAF